MRWDDVKPVSIHIKPREYTVAKIKLWFDIINGLVFDDYLCEPEFELKEDLGKMGLLGYYDPGHFNEDPQFHRPQRIALNTKQCDWDLMETMR
jgi:hypothetical protein